jgi:tRNA threonylcarbamoyladenosine biosynthesis protein TsaE
MSASPFSLSIQSPDEMAELARLIAANLGPGACVLLEGPVGAGKSHFARAAIQSLLDSPEDIPSPTFTLVQTYETAAGEIWHADLYRLTHPSEVFELGLDEAFETAICFVEWPDRLGSFTPRNAIKIVIEAGQEAEHRTLSVSGISETLLQKIKAVHV